MTVKSMGLSDSLYAYLLRHGVREPDVLARLRVETASHPMARMQISPEQGAFMAFLARLIDARRYLEVGVFTGYSSLAVALALPEGGQITACDVSEEFTAVARRYWAEAGVEDRVTLRLAPALDTLDALIDDGGAGSYDMAFLDADKTNYDAYFERCLVLCRPGGLILVDNVLWSGSVADPQDASPDTVAIRAFNEKRRTDDRVELVMLPVADGLSVMRKR